MQYPFCGVWHSAECDSMRHTFRRSARGGIRRIARTDRFVYPGKESENMEFIQICIGILFDQHDDTPSCDQQAPDNNPWRGIFMQENTGKQNGEYDAQLVYGGYP